MRMPRPLGTTLMAQNIQKTLNKEQKNKHQSQLIDYILKNYILNGYTINSIPYNLSQLSIMLGLKESILIGRMGKQVNGLSGFSGIGTDLKKVTDTLSGILIQSHLTNQGRITEQYGVLKASQQGEYKAFISGEVNRALDLLLKADGNLINILKAFQPSVHNTTITTQTLQGDVQNTQNVEYVTLDKAIGLLEKDTKPDGNEPLAPEELRAKYLTENVPEVVAYRQEGHQAQGSLIRKPMASRKKDAERKLKHDGIEDADVTLIP